MASAEDWLECCTAGLIPGRLTELDSRGPISAFLSCPLVPSGHRLASARAGDGDAAKMYDYVQSRDESLIGFLSDLKDETRYHVQDLRPDIADVLVDATEQQGIQAYHQASECLLQNRRRRSLFEHEAATRAQTKQLASTRQRCSCGGRMRP